MIDHAMLRIQNATTKTKDVMLSHTPTPKGRGRITWAMNPKDQHLKSKLEEA
jgi:hypothetical protein